jgi:hypothetical protein
MRGGRPDVDRGEGRSDLVIMRAGKPMARSIAGIPPGWSARSCPAVEVAPRMPLVGVTGGWTSYGVLAGTVQGRPPRACRAFEVAGRRRRASAAERAGPARIVAVSRFRRWPGNRLAQTGAGDRAGIRWGRGDPRSGSGAGAVLLAAEDAADDGDAVVDLRRGARGVAEDETGLAGLLAVPGQRLCLHAAG